jgi:cellulose synthase/poly-beta-1,6-N-acetylglucosamine synthase-like glycosyltransferase
MCCIGCSLLYVFLLFSCDPRLRLTIRQRLRVIQVSIFRSLPFFLVLNSWNVLHWLLSLYVFYFFSYAFLLLISHAMLAHLANMLAHKNAFMYRNMYTHKWTFVGTYKYIYIYMLRKIGGKDDEIFLSILLFF